MAMADLLRFAQALPLLLLITTSVSKLGVACENVEESGQPRSAPQARNLDHHPLGGPNSTSSLQDPLLSGLGRIPEKGSREYLALFLEETQWYNDLVLGPWMPAKWRQALPHVLESWLRNYVAGLFVYFATGGLWCLYVYYLKGDVYFPAGGIPSKEPVLLQIYVTMQAMPMYSGLPTVSEYMIERGWTRCYARVEEVGLLRYAALCTAYLIFIEFGIYWMHRLLHDIKPLYKSLHATHHIYNKQNTLSPFAGLAFHPLDGILQAAPHVVALFMIPTHLFTHELLMFLEGVWTTNIHDCIDGQVWGVMGAGYHTIHHTTYRHNYGHYTVWMDWMFGTLRDPIERLAAAKQS